MAITQPNWWDSPLHTSRIGRSSEPGVRDLLSGELPWIRAAEAPRLLKNLQNPAGDKRLQEGNRSPHQLCICDRS